MGGFYFFKEKKEKEKRNLVFVIEYNNSNVYYFLLLNIIMFRVYKIDFFWFVLMLNVIFDSVLIVRGFLVLRFV